MNSISALSVRDAAPSAIPSAAAWTTSPGNSMYSVLHYTIQLLYIVVLKVVHCSGVLHCVGMVILLHIVVEYTMYAIVFILHSV